ncbi:hypothetical protein PpBr36_04860 [Pyricularia pennisetigena]|uniref:hypothetical protein n=1 Tax=Pyricularia pennisetigena TaxID=1578925 RepID=UPI0011502088|nr:hypothetical protein PpBr36_04860 [Pyricularia pennisetigena]TLS26875.1 hypothetical protein PpBr36_04860 [Pyricularia pennisetigena]
MIRGWWFSAGNCEGNGMHGCDEAMSRAISPTEQNPKLVGGLARRPGVLFSEWAFYIVNKSLSDRSQPVKSANIVFLSLKIDPCHIEVGFI